MKIALVCNEYPPRPHGGIGTFTYALAHGLTARGHSVTVVGLSDEAGEWDDRGVRVISLRHQPVRFISALTQRLQLYRFLRAEVRAGRIDLVEIPDFLGLLPLRRGLGCPVVVRLHLTATAMSLHRGEKPRPSNVFCERRMLAVHDNWIGISKYSMDLTHKTFPGLRPRRARVIYCPIDGADVDESVRPPWPRYVVYAGSVQPRKGAVVLARAARTFLRDHPDVQLVYVGRVLSEGGRGVDELVHETIGDEQLSARVHFTGGVSRPQVLAYMRHARVFALPSTLETFGLVAAEAMQQGCPVVVSDEGPFPEFVQHGRTGLLVNPTDSDAVADAVGALLRDPQRAAEMGRAAREYVEQTFGLEAHLDETLRFYEECRRQPQARVPSVDSCAQWSAT